MAQESSQPRSFQATPHQRGFARSKGKPRGLEYLQNATEKAIPILPMGKLRFKGIGHSISPWMTLRDL